MRASLPADAEARAAENAFHFLQFVTFAPCRGDLAHQTNASTNEAPVRRRFRLPNVSFRPIPAISFGSTFDPRRGIAPNVALVLSPDLWERPAGGA